MGITSATAFGHLLLAEQLIYQQCGFQCSKPIAEPESAEYNACTFKLNQLSVRYRSAKITPTKVGQFVTLWKRDGHGPIQPFNILDDLDIVIISTRRGDRSGQFIFPKHVLHKAGILSDSSKDGKRGFRVYPPWDVALNKQAQKTQQWQLACFLEIGNNNTIDCAKAKILLTPVIF